MAYRVLSISYDSTLLRIRERLLEREGYEVVSAEGFVNALKCCQEGHYDVAVLGHSIPIADQKTFFEALNREHPLPVISLTVSGEPGLQCAVAQVDAFQPQHFINTVRQVLGETRSF